MFLRIGVLSGNSRLHITILTTVDIRVLIHDMPPLRPITAVLRRGGLAL
jgi:hypothetical protein